MSIDGTKLHLIFSGESAFDSFNLIEANLSQFEFASAVQETSKLIDEH